MIKFLVTGQLLQIVTPVVVADSHAYITCEFDFQTDDWEGLYKWAHFTLDGNTYHVPIYNDKIYASQHLDLTAGTWQVYVTGNELVDGVTVTRVTTGSDTLFVEATQIESPFPSLTPEFSEVLAAQIAAANETANSVREDADDGDFNGATFTPSVNGSGVISWTNDKNLDNPESVNIKGPKGDKGDGINVKGFYASYEALVAGVSEPSTNDCYGVGTASPYTFYLWDPTEEEWVNIGQINVVAAGFGTPIGYVESGEGTPACSIEASGPDTAKIFTFTFSGLQGHTPVKGTDYFTADDKAEMVAEVAQSVTPGDIGAIANPGTKSNGQFLKYNGTNWVADDVPYPVSSINGETGAITTRLIFSNVSVAPTDFTTQTSNPTYADYPCVAALSLTGVVATMFAEVAFNVAAATSGNFAPVAITGEGTVSIYAKEIPASAFTIPSIICWR